MSPAELLHDLRAQGLTLRVSGDLLLVRPALFATAERRALIAEHKAALVELLRKELAARPEWLWFRVKGGTALFRILADYPRVPADADAWRIDPRAEWRPLEQLPPSWGLGRET